MTTFRPMSIETDAAAMARLYSYTAAEPITPEIAASWWTLREGEIRVTMLAEDTQGTAIGFWDVDRETWMKPGHFYVRVIVMPEARGQGLGAQMYEAALGTACAHGATRLESRVSGTDAASLRFAEARGFRIAHHNFTSTLDLASFDEHRFDGLMARMHEQGFQFFSLEQAGLTDENKHKLYEVNRASALDNPGNDGIFPDFYAFSRDVFEAPWFRAGTQLLASHGDRWVGLSAVGLYPESRYAYNAFTGVLREYRGRGLARALKLQTILLARQAGMRYIRTRNDSKNAPMLAVNRRLGYRPEPGYYELLCVLDQDGEDHAEPS